MKKNYRLVSPFKFMIGAALVASCSMFQSCEDAAEAVAPQELAEKSAQGSVIAGQYIVVLKDDAGLRVSESASYDQRLSQVRNYGQQVLRERGISTSALQLAYGKALQGFSASLSEAEVAKLRRDPRVEYIEQDKIVSVGKPSGGGTTTPPPAPAQETPWGVNKVGFKDGTGKVAWVIDSGIDLDHPDLNVDRNRSKSFLGGKDARTADDANGHGTHVAGTIAAKNNTEGVIGVAYNATVVAVRVLDANGDGTVSGAIAGVDYVAVNGKVGEVANMSLSGGISITLDNAVISAAAKGVIFCLAAGNNSGDADNHSPARAEGANIYTISAYNSSNVFASFSNFGSHVDYSAPGVSIKSTWKDGTYNTVNGTSMATPHAAGIMLLTGGRPTISGYVLNDPDGVADPMIHL